MHFTGRCGVFAGVFPANRTDPVVVRVFIVKDMCFNAILRKS